MKRAFAGIVVSKIALLAAAAVADAAPVESADDVCPPATDPCVISSTVEVDSDFPLDFGLRTVRVVEPGKLVGTLDLSCGRFETMTTKTWLDLPAPDYNGDVTITALRRCSLDPQVGCLSDAACSDAGAGLCSAGDGTVSLTGLLRGNAPDVTIRAAFDVDLEGTVDVSSDPPAEWGGTVLVESSFGAIESSARIDASGGVSEEYYGSGPAFGGSIALRAPLDVTVRAPMLATGGAAYVDIDSGRDIVITSSILSNGRQGGAYIGGTIDLQAVRDLRVVTETGAARPILNIEGGEEQANYYGGSYAGPGGYAFFTAGRDVELGNQVSLLGDSGMSIGLVDDEPISGDWYFEAGEDIVFDAIMSNRAWGNHGSANHGVSFDAGDSVQIGKRGVIATNGAYSGQVTFSSSRSIVMNGRINTRGRKIRYYGYTYGAGGPVSMYGPADIEVGGKVMTGGFGYAGEIWVDACNLHLQRGGKLDSGWGAQTGGGTPAYFRIRESMTTDPGSMIRSRDAEHTIVYRDAAPVLNGAIKPSVLLTQNPGLPACPVCGNSEIEIGESCDDGNLDPGDGCDANCLVEP